MKNSIQTLLCQNFKAIAAEIFVLDIKKLARCHDHFFFIKTLLHSNEMLCQNLKAIGEEILFDLRNVPRVITDRKFYCKNSRLCECRIKSKFQSSRGRNIEIFARGHHR